MANDAIKLNSLSSTQRQVAINYPDSTTSFDSSYNFLVNGSAFISGDLNVGGEFNLLDERLGTVSFYTDNITSSSAGVYSVDNNYKGLLITHGAYTQQRGIYFINKSSAMNYSTVFSASGISISMDYDTSIMTISNSLNAAVRYLFINMRAGITKV